MASRDQIVIDTFFPFRKVSEFQVADGTETFIAKFF